MGQQRCHRVGTPELPMGEFGVEFRENFLIKGCAALAQPPRAVLEPPSLQGPKARGFGGFGTFGAFGGFGAFGTFGAFGGFGGFGAFGDIQVVLGVQSIL